MTYPCGCRRTETGTLVPCAAVIPGTGEHDSRILYRLFREAAAMGGER